MSEKPSRQSVGARGKTDTYEALSIFAWVAVTILTINVLYFYGVEIGSAAYTTEMDFVGILNASTIGLLRAGPTILIILALIDFAFFFQRCGEGDVFSQKNVRTLRGGADSLIAAAVVSAVVAPLILGAIGEPGSHDILDFTDLALGVGLMGIALHGFAAVLGDAVALKDDNDQIV